MNNFINCCCLSVGLSFKISMLIKIVETVQTGRWYQAHALEITLSLPIKHHDSVVIFVTCPSIFSFTAYLRKAASKERGHLSHLRCKTVVMSRLLGDLMNSLELFKINYSIERDS